MTVPKGAAASRGSVIHIKNEKKFSVSRSLLEGKEMVPSIAIRYLLIFEFKDSMFFCYIWLLKNRIMRVQGKGYVSSMVIKFMLH